MAVDRKMEELKICVCSPQYPTETDPQYSFVEQLVNAMAAQGVQITVIAPQSLVKHFVRGKELHPRKRIRREKGCEDVIIYQPYTLSFGSRFEKLNKWLLKRAIRCAYKKIRSVPDIFYGHFWDSAFLIADIAIENKRPLCVATGEASFEIGYQWETQEWMRYSQYIKKVVCVSSKNKNDSIRLGLTSESRCMVIPNASDEKMFYPRGKTERIALRNKYNIAVDDYVIMFCGAFIPRKGSDRVSQALSEIKGKKVYSIFVGAPFGEYDDTPKCDNIIFCGVMPHNKLPELLNIADVFVLPTLSEGCCNAIVEAISCGLPVISSDRDFNYDILDESNSILIDPMDINQIRAAILQLRDNIELREKLRKGAEKKAQTLRISDRAKTILTFINGE